MLLGEFEQVLDVGSVMRPQDFLQVRYLNTLSVLEGVMERWTWLSRQGIASSRRPAEC